MHELFRKEAIVTQALQMKARNFSPGFLQIVVLTRRLFHDDWDKIVHALKKQTGASFTLKPFHSKKALVSFCDPC